MGTVCITILGVLWNREGVCGGDGAEGLSGMGKRTCSYFS
jgi:hypothetical protein